VSKRKLLTLEEKKLRRKQYKLKNKERASLQDKAWVKANPEKRKETNRKSRIKRKARNKELKRAWDLANPDKVAAQRDKHRERRRADSRRWFRNNKAKANAHCAKRRASKDQRTPEWLSKEAKQQLLDFYTIARSLTEETGISYEVDHIIPLRGKIVSGLHVPWNLQILTHEENIKKHNTFKA
jgi:hypothetical protein